jgi:hypothetical protein
MNEKHIQMIGIVLITAGFIFISFLYWTEPRSLAEVSTKSQVAIGTYTIDRAEAGRGMASFNAGQFEAARASYARADPERRDGATQFYIAYSYYRQGWGRMYNDDALFKLGLESVGRVIEIDPNFRSNDQSLVMKTPIELKTELEEGLKLTPEDFNPMKLTRERR